MYFGLIEVVGILATLARGPRQVHLQFLSSSTQWVVVVGCRVDAEVKLDRGWGEGVKCLTVCPMDLSYSIDTSFDFLVETFRPL